MKRNVDQIKTEWLVLRSQAGDPDGFTQLVTHWHRRILAHVYRLTAAHDETSDIMQEVWLTVAGKLRRLKDPSCFPQWIYKIATAHSVDWVRRQERDRKLRTTIADNEASNTPVQASMADQNGAKNILKAAIRRLPEDQHTVLHLFYLDGLSTDEISTALAIPVGTVKSRLYHARIHLRQLIERSNK